MNETNIPSRRVGRHFDRGDNVSGKLIIKCPLDARPPINNDESDGDSTVNSPDNRLRFGKNKIKAIFGR